jgi:small subunit ribosomal protein S24e
MKKFEPKYRQVRAGIDVKKKKLGRRAGKDAKNRAKKVRGKEKTKVRSVKSMRPHPSLVS